VAEDTIFRIASLTKTFIAVAVMQLVERGLVDLDAPANQYLRAYQLVPARSGWRPATLRHLLTHTAGIRELLHLSGIWRLRDLGEAVKAGRRVPSLAEYYSPGLRIDAEPGRRFMYTNHGFNTLGQVIEDVSGLPVGPYLRQHVFEPLGMRDTAFSVPPEKMARLATSYFADPKAGTLTLYDPADGGEWARPPAFPSGGAGLLSTIDDYFAFGKMMLDGGGAVLSPASVRAMTSDQLTAEQKAASHASLAPGFWRGRGWGYGVSIAIAPDAVSAVPGRFGWDGGLGTSWTSHPSEQMVAILLTQRGEYPDFSTVYRDFWTNAYPRAGRG